MKLRSVMDKQLYSYYGRCSYPAMHYSTVQDRRCLYLNDQSAYADGESAHLSRRTPKQDNQMVIKRKGVK